MCPGSSSLFKGENQRTKQIWHGLIKGEPQKLTYTQVWVSAHLRNRTNNCLSICCIYYDIFVAFKLHLKKLLRNFFLFLHFLSSLVSEIVKMALQETCLEL